MNTHDYIEKFIKTLMTMHIIKDNPKLGDEVYDDHCGQLIWYWKRSGR